MTTIRKKIALLYEIILVILALISVIFIWSSPSNNWHLDTWIWSIFLVDVVVRFIKAEKKWDYIKHNPFDIIAAIPLDSIFQTARIVRLFRLLRFFAIGKKYIKPLQDILHTNGLHKVLTTAVVVIIISTVLVTHFEPTIETYADGLWWSIVTATTVGYGDLSPNTQIGRLVAIMLMLIGIGIVGMLTGSITTYFFRDNKKQNPTIDFIQSELARYDELTIQEKERLEFLLRDLNTERSS